MAQRIDVPSSPSSPVTMVIVHHGASEDRNSFFTQPQYVGTLAGFREAGWYIATDDAAGDNWGNQAALDLYVALYQSAIAAYPAITRVVHLGISMGGLTSLLTVVGGLVPAHGCAEIAAVCSLRSIWDIQGGLATQINTAYGIVPGNSVPAYLAATAGHDPLLVSAASFANVPLRFYASYADGTVPTTSNTEAMVNYVQPGAHWIDYFRVCTGDHTAPDQFRPHDLVTFFQQCIWGISPLAGRAGAFLCLR
jgi:hypothetical protein